MAGIYHSKLGRKKRPCPFTDLTIMQNVNKAGELSQP